MRWGEPNRLPPVRRGRGLAAAALLAVGLVAAYAILAVLSLTSVAPSILDGVPRSVPGFGGGGSVPAVTPDAGDFVHPTPGPSLVGFTDGLVVGFGRQTSGATLTKAIHLENTAAAPLNLSVAVTGALGVTATFPGQSLNERLAAGDSTNVTVSTNPLHAGPLDGGRVVISVAGVAKPLTVPLSGAQAPLPPGAVTATPEAGGAVHVTWPASPSTGVAGYEVERRVAGGQWELLPGSVPAAGIVDQTGTDGKTVDYRVSAITAGVSPVLPSAASAPGSAVTDASAPDQPTKIKLPDFVNQSNEDSVPVEVDLPPTSSSTDVVSVTLTDGTDGPVTATTAGGQPSVVVHLDARGLPEGPIDAFATVTDAVGNVSAAFPAPTPAEKDTVAPAPPAYATPPEVVNGGQAASVPVDVHVSDAETGERVHVQITGDGQTADGGNDVSGFVTTVNVDASKLPDGQLTVSAWTIDAAGNPSDAIDGGSFKKDTNAPEGALNIHIAGGEANPAGYVNAASANNATVVVHFADPTNPADVVVVNVAGNRFHRDGGEDMYTIGPIDLSGEPDGRLFLAATVTDPAGNSTTATDYAVKDTVAPSAPTSFTVPETADNAAGVVNSLTQSAAIIQATFPGGTDSSDSLSASVNGIDLGSQVGGSIAVQWRADVSSLPDGQLDLHGTITDAAGNTTDFAGRAVKETQPPPPPVAAHVIGFCRPDTIVPATANDVSVQVVLPDMPGFSGTVTVTLTDSAGHTASGTASGGPGIVVVHGIDAGSFVPGQVQLSVSITDSAGNTSTFAGTPAVYVDNTDE
jgi:hypothetical protein